MAPNDGLPITNRILDFVSSWHTKRHPFFLAFEGKLPLRALGRYQALHYHFVSRALASFGMLYARGYHFEDTGWPNFTSSPAPVARSDLTWISAGSLGTMPPGSASIAAAREPLLSQT